MNGYVKHKASQTELYPKLYEQSQEKAIWKVNRTVPMTSCTTTHQGKHCSEDQKRNIPWYDGESYQQTAPTGTSCNFPEEGVFSGLSGPKPGQQAIGPLPHFTSYKALFHFHLFNFHPVLLKLSDDDFSRLPYTASQPQDKSLAHTEGNTFQGERPGFHAVEEQGNIADGVSKHPTICVCVFKKYSHSVYV